MPGTRQDEQQQPQQQQQQAGLLLPGERHGNSRSRGAAAAGLGNNSTHTQASRCGKSPVAVVASTGEAPAAAAAAAAAAEAPVARSQSYRKFSTVNQRQQQHRQGEGGASPEGQPAKKRSRGEAETVLSGATCGFVVAERLCNSEGWGGPAAAAAAATSATGAEAAIAALSTPSIKCLICPRRLNKNQRCWGAIVAEHQRKEHVGEGSELLQLHSQQPEGTAAAAVDMAAFGVCGGCRNLYASNKLLGATKLCNKCRGVGKSTGAGAAAAAAASPPSPPPRRVLRRFAQQTVSQEVAERAARQSEVTSKPSASACPAAAAAATRRPAIAATAAAATAAATAAAAAVTLPPAAAEAAAAAVAPATAAGSAAVAVAAVVADTREGPSTAATTAAAVAAATTAAATAAASPSRAEQAGAATLPGPGATPQARRALNPYSRPPLPGAAAAAAAGNTSPGVHARQAQQPAGAAAQQPIPDWDGGPIKWTLDSPDVAAALDLVDEDALVGLCFPTVMHLAKGRRAKYMRHSIAELSARLMCHSMTLLAETLEVESSPQVLLRRSRAAVLQHLMPALITSPDGALGISRVKRISLLANGKLSDLVAALLLAGSKQRKQRPRKQLSEEELDADIVQLLGVKGGLRVAAERLQPLSAARADDACLATMQAKHPAAMEGEEADVLVAKATAIAAAAVPLSAAFQQAKEDGYKPELIASCVKLQSPFSGPGPSGLRYSHLQNAMDTEWGRCNMPRALSRLCKLMMHRACELPPLFWQLHCAARLKPLAEQLPGGGEKLRPIACGEVLQRLCTTMYVQDRKSLLRLPLERHGQLGVATPAGAERAAMATKLGHELGEWEITLDLANAFNNSSLLAGLEHVTKEMPCATDYIMATYIHTRPKLMFQHMDGTMHAITSQRGVKQGDPFGPVLFCGAISSCLAQFNDRAKAANAPQRAGAYMDDTGVHLRARALSAQHIEAMQQLEADFRGKGCSVNYAKSGALPGKGHAVTLQEQQLLQGLGIQLKGGLEDGPDRGMVVLGVPVGNSAFVADWVRRETGPDCAAVQFTQRCASLRSSRAIYRLLRYSAVPRLSYMLRNVPPEQMEQASTEWDDRILWVLERSMGFQPRGVTWQQFREGGARYVLSGAALQQAHLPVRHGGLGVISAAKTSHAAYVACCVAALPDALAERAVVYVRGEGGDAAEHLTPVAAAAILDAPLVHSLTAALQVLRGELGDKLGHKDGRQTLVPQHLWQFCTAEDADAAAAEAPLAVRGGGFFFRVQAQLTERLAKKRSEDLLASLIGLADATDRLQAVARYKSLLHQHSIGTAFLNEPLFHNSAAPLFDGTLFEYALRRTVGVEKATRSCHLCGLARGGSLHARFCRSPAAKGHDTIVHNALVRALERLLKRYLRVPVSLETHVPFVIGGARHDPGKRMDIVLPHGAFGGGDGDGDGDGDDEEGGQEGVRGDRRPREHMLDVSVVEAQCASHAKDAARDPKICSDKREKEKKDHYSGFYNQDCYTLATVAIGSFGYLGAEAVKVVQAMANAYAAREFRGEEGGISYEALAALAKSFIRASLSSALQMALSVRVRAYFAAQASDAAVGLAGGGVGVMSGVAVEDPDDGAG